MAKHMRAVSGLCLQRINLYLRVSLQPTYTTQIKDHGLAEDSLDRGKVGHSEGAQQLLIIWKRRSN